MRFDARPGVSAASRPWMGERALDALIVWATRLSRRRAWAITTLAVAAAVAASHAVGPNVWFGPLYLLIICLPAWTIGRLAGFATGICCASASIAVNGVSTYPVGEAAVAWNLAMRMVAVATIVLLVGGFRRSHDREWQRARSDDLTGALTKHAFHEQVAATRRHEWGVLAYVDLDGFKQINDCHGHAAGDAVLRTFAAGLRAHIRPDDVFARIGGDEFLLFLAARNAAEGGLAAQRLHARMNAILAALPYPIRCSTGALLLRPDEARVMDAEVAMADRLMYEAKQQGRAALRIDTTSHSVKRETPADALPSREAAQRRAA